jgi:hypothetical protein
MKFEHHNQKVIPFNEFIKRLVRYSFFSVLLILFSVSLGTVGYHIFAQLGWIDSFHSSCLILTGMGPVKEMITNSAKIFDSVFALYSGVAFLTIIAVFFAPVVHRLLHKLHVEADDEK